MMDKASISSRKSLNTNLTLKGEGVRLPSRDGRETKLQSINESQLSSTQDSFFRKSGKGFGQTNRTDYGIIKSDLFQIQEKINENLYFTKMYKITSKSPNFTKKLSEIEDGKDVKHLVEKITEDAANVDRTGKVYNCTSTADLIQKLSLDAFYLDLILKKINEYFLLLHLKISGDENLYQETFSKFSVIKLVIEKLLEKYYDNSDNNSSEGNSASTNNININTNIEIINEKKPSNVNHDTFLTENKNSEEIKHILESKSLNDLIINFKDSQNPAIKHIITLFTEFFDKLNSNYNDLIQKNSSIKLNNQNSYQIENFFTQKLLIEKILVEKDDKLKKTNKERQDKQESNKELEQRIKNLEEELSKLKKENENLKSTLELEVKKEIEIGGDKGTVDSLKKIIEENNKTINQIKASDEQAKSKLYEEIKDLSSRLGNLENKHQFITKEKEELEKKVEYFSKNAKKDIDIDSYEQLMQEQFDNMKNTFLKKIEQLNEETSQIKLDSRRKVNMLQEDLTQAVYVKDLFLRQITELQKRLGDI